MYRLSKTYNCPPSELWGFPPRTVKAFYLNRGVWAFGIMVENEMNAAENLIRKRHAGKKSGTAEKFLASERLRILGIHLREDLRRFREPGAATNRVNKNKSENVEQTLGDGFFKLKTK